VAILARAGFEVAAATGKPDRAGALRRLGAAQVIDRSDLLRDADRLLLKGEWAGAVDTVGGAYLDAALRSVEEAGVVAACGNAASHELSTNVYPFILRGVRLQGIDSANCPIPVRRRMWDKLAGPWQPDSLDALTDECGLSDLSSKIDAMLEGGSTGRTVVRCGERA
jgi:putative YhdH/YhfP family quinone oxidoreductase